MSDQGQAEKNSVRAYVFRFALELGHCSTESACLKRANCGHCRAAHCAVVGPEQGPRDVGSVAREEYYSSDCAEPDLSRWQIGTGTDDLAKSRSGLLGCTGNPLRQERRRSYRLSGYRRWTVGLVIRPGFRVTHRGDLAVTGTQLVLPSPGIVL